jgi:hypothetical protein
MRRVALALMLLCATPVARAAPPGSLELEEVEERVTGDALAATLVVRAEADARLTVAPIEIEGLAVRSISSPRYDSKTGAHRVAIELVALEPGARWIGPFTVELHRAGTTTRIEIPPKLVEIRSLLVGATSLEPKPPSEPLPILTPDTRVIALIYVALAALVFGLVGALVARELARRRRAQRPPPPPRPAWEIALEALSRLRDERDRGLDEAGIEVWADAVSDVLREYLGARYGFDGLESTTDELVASLHAREPSDARLEDVRGFLRECDLVKFARARLELTELDRLLDAATHIVKDTRGFVPLDEARS